MGQDGALLAQELLLFENSGSDDLEQLVHAAVVAGKPEEPELAFFFENIHHNAGHLRSDKITEA